MNQFIILMKPVIILRVAKEASEENAHVEEKDENVPEEEEDDKFRRN